MGANEKLLKECFWRGDDFRNYGLFVVRFFKDHLKSEIGVFFSNILLRILESANSSGQQKLLVVQSLRVLVRPQLHAAPPAPRRPLTRARPLWRGSLFARR